MEPNNIEQYKTINTVLLQKYNRLEQGQQGLDTNILLKQYNSILIHLWSCCSQVVQQIQCPNTAL